VLAPDQLAAQDRAEEDRHEGARLDQRVAADELLGREVLREDRVLHGPEERRVQPHEEEHGHQELEVFGKEPHCGEDHNEDLDELNRAHHATLFELVGDLSGERGKEEERQNEHAARGRHELGARQAKNGNAPVCHEDHQGVF
jgi:hypothetical protein